MFKKIKSWFCARCFPWANGPDCDDHRIINSKIANATTPDDIIAAHIIQSFTKDITACKRTGSLPEKPGKVGWRGPIKKTAPLARTSGLSARRKDGEVALSSASFTVQIEYKQTHTPLAAKAEGQPRYREICTEITPCVVTKATVNGIDIAVSSGEKILAAYSRLLEAHNLAEKVAAKARAEMELNEKKWNLAENLLGMKRDENGALRPMNFGEKMVLQKKQQANK